MILKHKQILQSTEYYITQPVSLCWQGDLLIDWVNGGNTYDLQGNITDRHRGWGYSFDNAISTPDGLFTILYKRLGTKGLLLKNGKVLRELNRAYYQSEVYEYPLELFQLPDGQWAIAHCPIDYCRIDIEIAETGEIITLTDRKTQDCFYSRLQVNASGKYMLHAGWVWHPVEVMDYFEIPKVLENPALLDEYNMKLDYDEVSSARFFHEPDHLIVISTSKEDFGNDHDDPENRLPPSHIAIFDVQQKKLIKRTAIDFPFGNVIPVSMDYALDIYKHPKLIDLNTGKIVSELPGINTGEQRSSIIGSIEKFPPIAIDMQNKRLAVATETGIELIEII